MPDCPHPSRPETHDNYDLLVRAQRTQVEAYQKGRRKPIVLERGIYYQVRQDSITVGFILHKQPPRMSSRSLARRC
jgi:hypothetical protein